MSYCASRPGDAPSLATTGLAANHTALPEAEPSIARGPHVAHLRTLPRPIEAAVTYTRRSWRVLPVWWPWPANEADFSCACGDTRCSRVGKHPIGPLAAAGSRSATLDESAIRRWFVRYPLANLAVATGPASGVDVIDIDGPVGVMAAQELLHAGRMPPGPYRVAATGRPAGWHLYVPATGARNATGDGHRLPDGLDYRGDGGYAVAPPSLHESGNRYRWHAAGAVMTESQVVELLQAELDRTAGQRPRTAPSCPLNALPWNRPQCLPEIRPKGVAERPSRSYRADIRGLAQLVASAPTGKRNKMLYFATRRVADHTLAGQIDLVDAIDQLLTAATCAGLGDSEAAGTIGSGLRAGLRGHH